MKPGVGARAAAARALGRVMRGGAYSNIVVNTETADLPAEERRTARRLLYGPLRHLPLIDLTLAEIVDRPLEALDPPTLDLLRVGAYELVLGETPPHAAVNSTVESARLAGQERSVPLINAVLRRISREGHQEPAERDLALRLGQPEWVVETLSRQWGREEASEFLTSSQLDAPISFWLDSTSQQPGQAEPVAGIAGAFTTRSPAPHEGPGLIRVDPSSVAVAQALGSEPGLEILDMAAAPGGKTLILEAGSPSLLVAGDVHEGRVGRARRRTARVGSRASWVVMDGIRPPFRPNSYDRVLVDAPCTGLGTLRRRPEIRYRVDRGDPGRLGRLQRRLVESALDMVRPHGLVVYSVCTVLAEETVDVIEGLNASPPSDLPGRAEGDGWLLGPHLTGTDGMFVAQIRKT